MNVRATLFLVFGCLAFLSGVLRSQPAGLSFEHLTTLDGLSQDIVTCVHRDRFGFLWIGTEDGLNLYDGYTLKVYKHDPGDSTTIISNWVMDICDFGSEDLIVSTRRGISIYLRAGDSFRPPGGALSGYADLGFQKTCRDSAGNYWIIMSNTSLLKCSPDLRTVRRFDFEQEAPEGPLRALTADARGRVIAAAGTHLYYFEPGRDDPKAVPLLERTPSGVQPVEPCCLLEIRGTGLWVGSKRGLYRFTEEGASLAFVSLEESGAHGAVRRDRLFELVYDGKGFVWCAGFGGLYCYDPASGRSRSYRNLHTAMAGPNPPRLYAVFVDPAEILWAGSWRDGLWKANLHHAQFGLLRHSPATPFTGGGSDIAAMDEDSDGRIWFGDAKRGVTILDPRTNQLSPFPPPGGPIALSGTEISAIAGDSAGNVWIASAHNVVDWYNVRTRVMRSVRLPAKPGETMTVLVMHVDRRGDLWIGTEVNGIYRFDVRRGTLASLGEGDRRAVAMRSCWSIYSDRAGNVWVGGWVYNANLFRIDGGSGGTRSYPDAPLQAARAMAEDAEGILWVGTWGNGLTRLDPATGRTRNYTDRDGLPSTYIKGILRDDHGALWLSTEKGLSVFTPSSGSFRNYDVNDGLQGNFFYSGSCLRTRDGKFCFGGTGGVNCFAPDSIRSLEYTAPVVLTAFRVAEERSPNEHVEHFPGRVEVSYLDDVFGFDFVALDYRAPSRIRYAFMMEGFNSSWIDAGSRRYASYTHLDPGEYVFKVKGTNSDGLWNPAPASLRVTIAPVYWQRWWFQGMLALLALGMLWALYRYRMRKLLELERTRSAIATDLHDDIGAGLTNIALFSDLAKRDIGAASGTVIHRLEKIAATSRELLDSMNDIVWSIKPENDALEQTILRMEDYAVQILEDAGIDLSVEIPDHLRALKLPMEVRRHLFLIFKESIGNVLKHSEATTVKVAITTGNSGQGERGLLLAIADNGKGFHAGHQRLGNGLQNIDTRAHHLRGAVRVTSAPGEGTNVTIWLPLNSPI